MTEEEALEILWDNKDVTKLLSRPKGWEEHFLYATLKSKATMRIIGDERRPGNKEKRYSVPKGTTVLVTMVSRFGDVGIRDRDLEPPSHGYWCRVVPSKLKDWRDKP